CADAQGGSPSRSRGPPWGSGSSREHPTPHGTPAAVPRRAATLRRPAARAEAIGPTVITRVDDLIDAPRTLFGRTRAQVEGTLGEPQELTEGRYLYLYSDGYPDTVEVYFRDHRVYRIEWNYWTE